jgi:predicted Zn finger-like uncharacterized protein
MRWTCPKCGKKLEVSNEQLIANDGVIVCPQCLLQAHQPIPKARVTAREDKEAPRTTTPKTLLQNKEAVPNRATIMGGRAVLIPADLLTRGITSGKTGMAEETARTEAEGSTKDSPEKDTGVDATTATTITATATPAAATTTTIIPSAT